MRDAAALKAHYEHQVLHRNQHLDQMWKENEDWRVDSGGWQMYMEYLEKELYKATNKD